MKSGNFNLYEDRVNAHVDTFNEPPVAVLLGVFRQTAIPRCQHGKDVSLRGATKWRRGNLNLAVLSPFSGRGSFAFIVQGHFPSLTLVNRSEPAPLFVSIQKMARLFVGQGRNSRRLS